ncbi:MAG: hypothetical protein JST15_08545 [Bacteroidetes bacterium]|nr:hypothetical protein [Bacteroidota bacterium]
MNLLEFEIVEFIPHNPNDKSSFYSIKLLSKSKSEAEEFFEKFEDIEKRKIDTLFSNIENMAHRRGVIESLFKEESKIDDNIFCLKSEDLRLYCLKYSKVAVILGGGDYKHVKKYQESEELHNHVKILQLVCKQVDERIKNKEISITDNSIEGNLIFKLE